MDAPEWAFLVYNNMAETGRPPTYETAVDFQTKVDTYFEYIKGEQGVIKSTEEGVPDQLYWIRKPEPPTITGLALFLGFESRQSFYDYEEKPEFSYTVKRARMAIESQYEKNLHGTSPTGSIFALKNMGWRDKVETGFTDNDGNDVQPVQLYIPDNGRDKTDTGNTATAGLPGEGA